MLLNVSHKVTIKFKQASFYRLEGHNWVTQNNEKFQYYQTRYGGSVADYNSGNGEGQFISYNGSKLDDSAFLQEEIDYRNDHYT